MLRKPYLLVSSNLHGEPPAALTDKFDVVRFVPETGNIDPAALARDPSLRSKVQGVATFSVKPDVALILNQLPDLQWVQSFMAGTDNLKAALKDRPDVVISNASPLHAEWTAQQALILGGMIMRGHHVRRDEQRAEFWNTAVYNQQLTAAGVSYTGKRVLVLGGGEIAQEFIRLLAPWKPAHIAIAAKGDEDKQKIIVPAIEATEAGWSHSQSEIVVPRFVLSRILAEINGGVISAQNPIAKADIIVSILPGKEGTIDIVNAAFLKAMKPTAYLVNAGRGNLVVEADLHAALINKVIAGAAIDVARVEPAPKDWVLHDPAIADRFIFNPHIAGGFPPDRGWEFLTQAALAWHAGRPIRRVDPGSGKVVESVIARPAGLIA